VKVGTKSLLWGYHCPLWHTFFLAYSWYKLYGIPWHPALWLCFLFHDIGYWGCDEMDGNEGILHPESGAFVLWLLCGPHWGDFCMYHSRSYTKMHTGGEEMISKLCVADKQAILYTPRWLINKDELAEYMKNEQTENIDNVFTKLYMKVREFVSIHKDTALGPENY
jgi:hypothetical protein